jgi:hypothetical protein
MKKLLIVLAVLVLAAPTMAAEWNFYGQARFATWSTDVDMDVPGQDSDRDTLWNQQGNSRIGATVKFNDEIGGGFEMNDSFGKRKLYGTYNFGVGQLLIGQDYTPTSSYFYSNSVYNDDGDLLGIGQFYVGRVPMIQLKFGDLKLAFVKPNTDDYAIDAAGPYALDPATGKVVAATPAQAFDTDVTIPKIELSYGYKGEMFFVDVFGGYQTYEIEMLAGPSYDIDAYVAGIGAGVTVGPVWFKAGFHMGENLGNYGNQNTVKKLFDNENLFYNKAVISATGRIEDQDGLGYLAVLGFKANDMLTFGAGYGREETEIDTYEADVTQYYLNATVNFTKGFFMVPEIGMIENSVDGSTPEPEIFYLGAKWQINF